jgi:4'-phosphopantetheinyl transferase
MRGAEYHRRLDGPSGVRHHGRMDLTESDVVDLGDTGARAVVVVGGRRVPGVEAVLREHLASTAEVPADDIELDHACAQCGARHGSPVVSYPTTASGGRWYADAAVAGAVVVAAVGPKLPLGVGVEPATADAAPLIDEAALHPEERALLAELDPATRPLVRAQLWARKAALLRAVGHVGVIEPSMLALTSPLDDDGVGRIARTLPEFGSRWGEVRFHDVAVPGRVAASVAVLPRP